MHHERESIGLCFGASTIGFVRLRSTEEGVSVLSARTRTHDGDVRKSLEELLGMETALNGTRIAATGRKFQNRLALSSISEPEAVELAAGHILPPNHPYRVIISVGAETFLVYHLEENGRIQGVHTGNKCASGTGEFFLQQLGRMDIGLEEVGRMEAMELSHKVSGRCSVFCKSDCTHALNKGVPKPQVVAGLAKMMCGKIVELLRQLPRTSVMLVGGCTENRMMVHYLREEIDDLFVPVEARWFEALGAALWALNHETQPLTKIEDFFSGRRSNLSFLRPLSEFREMVEFKDNPRSSAEPGDRVIVGLDVGSTTTKGVVMRRRDKAILAAEYLRTNGDPVGASRRVYESLASKIDTSIDIEGLGVTGSGRQIAGLHAMTDGVINEIIAHATAAVHFDPEVDTIFEIGGQDAKYTYITNGVPSDYAMNEACSAGTGSFLEEAAKESLGLDVTTIGRTAYEGKSPPNFNDQCAAFIGSDIKRAVQEGISVPDIVAGLVYSICMNYANRVKGSRPVGRKVFMQGGVCYNEAIPAAMAALTGKPVIVPPEPGLMGAFGVALEVERRIERGLLDAATFDLAQLAAREVRYLKPFFCKGGKERCDRGCEVARIEIAGKVFPFGGICNRYDNLVHKRKVDVTGLDLVVQRERRVFRDYAAHDPQDCRPTVGMNRSFLVHTYFPLYNRFFSELGFRVVLPDAVDQAGLDQQGAAFCFPAELAHGYAANLLDKEPDFFFLPHVRGTPAADAMQLSCTCPFVQGEPYYLGAAFPRFDEQRTLKPYFDFTESIESNVEVFRQVGRQLGVGRARVKSALAAAISEQESFFNDIRQMGMEALAHLQDEPERVAVVLFGRAYNSFAAVANKGIPAKFASRGVRIIPFDMLPCEAEELEADHHMYWAAGRSILKAAHYVKKNPQLFGTYITNFSCGPDSFIVGYFRDVMGRKPSLTLELDNHTADAGIETRIEAFLDIVQYYRQSSQDPATLNKPQTFRPAAVESREGKIGIRTSSGEWVPLDDDRVKVIVPAMGRHTTPLLAKAFACRGIRAVAMPPADDEVLKLGRGHSTCKECLPLQTTLGSLLHHVRHRPAGELTVYFMVSADGPCRFGQYHVLSKRVIEKLQIQDVAVLSLTSNDGYGGLGDRFALAAWQAIVIGDLLEEAWATILAAAVDREKGLAIFEREHQAIMDALDKGWPAISKQLSRSANNLAEIRLKRPYHELPKLSLIGEIYVRRDPISLQNLIERLADRGFVVRTAQTSEWLKYVDWLTKKRIEQTPTRGFHIRLHVKRYFDRKIRKKLAPSGLIFCEDADVEPIIEAGSKFVSPYLTGEAILTVGSALHEIFNPSCGIIAIGPFGCMPSRIAEAILKDKFTTAEIRAGAISNGRKHYSALMEGDCKLPFLAIETDGNAFPQIIEVRLEAFMLQAMRLNDRMLQSTGGDPISREMMRSTQQ